MDSIPKVFLWCVPRTLSTAFERSIRELRNGKVFHNPFMDAHYCGPDRNVTEFAEFGTTTEAIFGPVQPDLSYEKIIAGMSPPYDPGYAFIFANVTPHYTQGRYEEVILHEGFKDFVHTFLIRNPHKMVPSLYRLIIDSFGRDYLNPDRCDYEEVFDIYELIVKRFNTQPIVVDADDILQDPEGMMRLYCEKANLPYDENMTKWEPGMVADWEKCHFRSHIDVAKSSGFIRKEKSDEKCPISDLYYENDVIRKMIDKSFPYYNALYERRLRL